MANIIVVPFKKEKEAIEALHKIKELDSCGDITLYEYMMIRKIENNQFKIVNNQTGGKCSRILTGEAVGRLLGVLTGPVGFVTGLYSSLGMGAVVDNSRYELEKKFIKKVSNKLSTGVIAIIAEVSKDSSVFIKNALSNLALEILMRESVVIFDDYLDEQIQNLEGKLEEERKNIKTVVAAEKIKVKIRISNLKAQRKTKVANLEVKRKFNSREFKVKIIPQINRKESHVKGNEYAVANSFEKRREKKLKKKIIKQEKKLEQLHSV